MRDLNEVFVFVTVVDQKGFSSASCALKLPKLPTKLDEPSALKSGLDHYFVPLPIHLYDVVPRAFCAVPLFSCV